MQQTYKGYRLHSAAAGVRNTNAWKPISQVNWKEHGEERVKLWMEWHFQNTFASYEEAELAGLVFAKKWVDDQTNRKE